MTRIRLIAWSSARFENLLHRFRLEVALTTNTQQRLRWSRILAVQSCPSCSRRLRVPDGKQGTVTCPHCGSEWFHPEAIEHSKTRTTSGYIKGLAFLAVVFALIYYAYTARQSTLAAQAKRELDMNMDVLHFDRLAVPLSAPIDGLEQFVLKFEQLAGIVSANSSENVPNVVRNMARWASRSVVGA
jgi:hypothetical protein